MTARPNKLAYGPDLAFVHDTGFGGLALAAAQELLAQLGQARQSAGTIIDLGCGSGILAEAVSAAGFSIVGFDISKAMIALARARVPRGEFHHESFLSARLPAAVAVVAIGEVFNYLFDRKNSDAQLQRVLRRVHRALVPGGILLFEIAGPGRAGPEGMRQGFTETEDWACLYKAEEDKAHKTLTRSITTFRRRNESYHREHEVHRLRLIEPRDAIAMLKTVGFRARIVRKYAQFVFPPGWCGILAKKPV